MARSIQVTPELLDSAAKKITDLAGQYKTLYDKLYSKTEAMSSSWQGKDNQAFISQINGFKDDLEKMKALMDEYATFLTKSAKAYRDSQDTISTEAKKLAN